MLVERNAAASDTLGGDTGGLTVLAEPLGADWLPSTTRTADGGRRLVGFRRVTATIRTSLVSEPRRALLSPVTGVARVTLEERVR